MRVMKMRLLLGPLATSPSLRRVSLYSMTKRQMPEVEMFQFTVKLMSTFFNTFLRQYFHHLPKLSWSQSSHSSPSIITEPSTRSLLQRIPSNAWDSHMHIIDPTRYPLSADAIYTPRPHLLSEALRFESSIGFTKIVLVQPSIYGYDNSCMLDALKQLGSHRARAVVTLDPELTSFGLLEEWHKLGVRGVRVNLQSVGRQMERAELARTLRRYADLIRPLGWVLQLYVSLDTIAVLEDIIPSLRVKVCFDHFGHPVFRETSEGNTSPSAVDPYTIRGFNSLTKMLEDGCTYVKMSAAYRISCTSPHEDLELFAKELLRVAGRRNVVFATDWPHTRFEGLDIKPFMEQVLDWCEGDQMLIDRVFRGNAESLWGP